MKSNLPSVKSESFNKMLEESFRRNWDNQALSDYGCKTICYKDLAKEIAQLHMVFESCGVCKGDKIAICSKNQINWAVAFLSIITYGAVAVPILHEFKPANISHLVTHSESKVLFIGERIWDKVCEMELPLTEAVVTLENFDVVRAKSPGPAQTRKDIGQIFAARYSKGFHKENISYYEDRPEELALINYTSGTSGFSKGVMLPYRSLYSNVRFASEVEPQMSSSSKMLSMLPTAHMYGMVFDFLYEMALGAHVYFLTRLPSPPVLLEALGSIKPDAVVAVPMIIEKIYKKMLLPFISKTSIKLLLNLPVLDQMVKNKILSTLIQAFGGNFSEVIVGGAAFNREAEAFLRRINFPFTIGYGMTECGPIITYAPWNKTKLYSCGKAAPRMKVKISSSDPENVPGEVLVKGDNLFLGYYKNEEATAEALDSDGWFHTGDLGVMDKDGYLYLKGRCKSMILGPSGQNVYPEEIESVLNNMAYVVESLVIEDNGKLVALIFPDFEQAEKDSLSQDALLEKLKEEMKIANLELPEFCKLASVEIFPEEFEKTPKRSIKRFLYQRSK